VKRPFHILTALFILATPVFAQWGADSQPTRTTTHHPKRVIGYVTQWDAWKGTSAGFTNFLTLITELRAAIGPTKEITSAQAREQPCPVLSWFLFSIPGEKTGGRIRREHAQKDAGWCRQSALIASATGSSSRS